VIASELAIHPVHPVNPVSKAAFSVLPPEWVGFRLGHQPLVVRGLLPVIFATKVTNARAAGLRRARRVSGSEFRRIGQNAEAISVFAVLQVKRFPF
jgi:hypothetical protein